MSSEEAGGEERMVRDLNARDKCLVEAIDQHPLSGTNYFSCIQCGRCVGACPATRFSPAFNIREINRRIRDGDESILDDPSIWDCFYCQACVNACPKNNIDGYKTIIILRDLALNKNAGVHHMKRVLPVIATFMEKGVLTDEKSWLDPACIEELHRLNEQTGFKERFESLKNKCDGEEAP